MKQTQGLKDTDTLCPACGADWDAGDIFEALQEEESYQDYTHQELLDTAKLYGWTPEQPKRFSKKIGVYDFDLDMTVYWQCPDCGQQWDRFTGQPVGVKSGGKDDDSSNDNREPLSR